MKLAVYFFLAVLVLLAALGGAYLWMVRSVEQPNYVSVERDGAFEIRDYPALVVAEITQYGERQRAANRAFSPLAAYIFAKEREGDGIAMTAPVTQQRRETIAMTAPVTQTPDTSGEDAWVVRFIMPSQYTLETLPKPKNAEVRLVEIPAQRRAAVRFGGVATDESFAENEAALRAWMKERGLTPIGVATYAYYDDPFTPGFMRRNEVLFDIAGGQAGQEPASP